MAKRKITTEEQALEAVRQSGDALKNVPEELKTTEVCLEAVKNYIYALEYVPEKLKTVEMCIEAVKNAGESRLFACVPKKIMSASPEEFGAICLERIKYYNYKIQHVPSHHLSGMETSRLKGEINQIFEAMPEELREEVRIRLKSEGEWVPDNMKQYAAEVNIGALTQEAIRFELGKLSEKALNSVPPDTPYRNFSLISDFVTDNIKVFVIIPDHREVPKSITVKLTNTGETAEQRETVINCNGRFAKAELEGIAILQAAQGRPRPGYRYRQKAEITLNFENRSEPLICPISRTTTFSICFFDAYEAQGGRIDSVGTIYEFSEEKR